MQNLNTYDLAIQSIASCASSFFDATEKTSEQPFSETMIRVLSGDTYQWRRLLRDGTYLYLRFVRFEGVDVVKVSLRIGESEDFIPWVMFSNANGIKTSWVNPEFDVSILRDYTYREIKFEIENYFSNFKFW